MLRMYVHTAIIAGDLRGRTGVTSGQAGIPLRAESRMYRRSGLRPSELENACLYSLRDMWQRTARLCASAWLLPSYWLCQLC